MPKDFVKPFHPLKQNSKLLVLGAGFSGQRIAKIARALGTEVLCSRRDIKSPGADLQFDSKTPDLPSIESLKNITHVLS